MPGVGAGAGARRHHRAHARPRRPSRRHRRAREEARLHRRRAGRAGRLAAGKQGLENVLDPNKGGTVDVDGVKFTLTNAHPLELEHRRLEYMGEPVGIVVDDRGRAEALLRRRHVRVRRHAAHRPHLLARTSRSCRSATTTRWARRKPRSRSSSSARSAASPATGARSRRSTGLPTQLRELAPDVEIDELEPGESVTL